jgi:hypothetical protein
LSYLELAGESLVPVLVTLSEIVELFPFVAEDRLRWEIEDSLLERMWNTDELVECTRKAPFLLGF